MSRWILLVAIAGSGCESSGEVTTVSSGSSTKSGSGAGFSANLANQLGSGSAAPRVDADAAKAGSASTGDGSGSGTKAGSAVAVSTGSGDGSAAKAGSGSAAKSGSGSAVVKIESGSAAGSGSAAKPAVGGGSSAAINTSAQRVPVKPPAEIAAIKLSLSPNWDRDVGEAATISLVVKVPGRDESRVFAFRYGYEDPKAPTDRDAYKKWLADNKIFTVNVDRQRGAAWYLEGVDGAGAPAFRFLVNYGGKKLICGGLLYKDPISNQLGDIRDKTVIQAKEICESVTL